jgi:zinc-dependent metalloproteinase lipoprotein
MKTYVTFIVLLFFCVHQPYAQNICGTVEAEKELREKFPNRGTIEEFENWLAPKIKEFKSRPDYKSAALVKLPIIFHIMHRGEVVGAGDNLAKRFIDAQIAQINLDFTNGSGSTVPIAADLEINFCPARVDPDGNVLAEPGINRISRADMGYTTAGSFSDRFIQNTIKPETQWDPNRYINVWVVPISGDLIGFAQFPDYPSLAGLGSDLGSSTEADAMVASTDGVVVTTIAIGSLAIPNPRSGGWEQVLTHELGHFFGLRHIWGDPPVTSTRRCRVDDFCDDTPRTRRPNRTCDFSNQCDDVSFGASTDLPDMTSNYMDYSVPCFDTFTPDQSDRVGTILNEAPRRKELLNSTACDILPIVTLPDIFPCIINPFISVPSIGLVFDVCNPSAFQIPPLFAGIYLSPVLENPIPQYYLDEIQLPAINPQDQIQGFQFAVNLNDYPDIPAGDYMVLVVADHRNELIEENEDNNQMASAVTVNYLGNGCDNVVELSCNQPTTFSHSSNAFPNFWEDYECSTFTEVGAERIFSFETTQAGDVTIQLTNVDTNEGSSWAYLMNYCNPNIGSCIEDGGQSFTVNNLAAGKYYIAVEEYTGFDSEFILEITCESSQLPCTADVNYVCNDIFQFNMSNFTTNRNSIYSCENFDESDNSFSGIYAGPEVIHSFFLQQGEDIAFGVFGAGMVVFLVDNCQQNTCIAFAEDGEFTFYPQLGKGNYLLVVEQTDPSNQDYGLFVSCDYQQSVICPEVLNLEHGPIPTGTYHADKVINATVELNQNSNVSLKAGMEINLGSAVEVGIGSTFSTSIEACAQQSFSEIYLAKK